MRKIANLIFAGSIVFYGTVSGWAEPSPSVDLLMKEPVSLFSMGLYRMREIIDSRFGYTSSGFQLKEPLSELKKYATSVHYDWNNNRITIFIIQYEPSANAEEECRQLIEELRRMALLNFSPKYSFFASTFLPEGYSQDRLENAGSEIDKIIELRIQNSFSNSGFRCSATLLGTGYSVDK